MIKSDFVTRNGSKILLRTYGRESDPRRCLILIHGSGGHGEFFSEMAEKFAKDEDLRILVPDLRGHGEHPDRRGDLDYVGQLDDDLEDLIRSLKTSNRNTKIILGGHSAGGGYALGFAGRHPELLDGLLLFAPYLGWDAPTTRKADKKHGREHAKGKLGQIIFIEILSKLGLKLFQGWPVMEFISSEGGDDTQPTRRNLTRTYTYRMVRSFLFVQYKEPLEVLKKHNVPLFILIGRDDQSFDAEKYETTVSQVNNRAQVKIFDGCDHNSILNEDAAIEQSRGWMCEISGRTKG